MNALLLAGGLGTRLRPLTEQLPKPMALVGNQPWLEHLIIHLREQNIRDIVIAVKHFPEIIQNYFEDGSRWGVRIRYAVERTLLGTAGAIKNAEPLLDDRFIVLNADIVHNIRLQPLLSFHSAHDGAVTIGLKKVDDPSSFGVVEQDPEGRIVRFVEKPAKHEAPSRRVNAGIYIMEKHALDNIPANKEVSIERETFPSLINNQSGVYGAIVEGYWMDMGTVERYRQVHWDLLNGKFPLPLPGNQQKEGIWIGEQCDIPSSVKLVPPVLIGSRVRIGEGSVIGPFTVIGDDCKIGKNVRAKETILWDRCLTHNGVVLNHCVFGYDLEVGSRHILHEAVMSRLEAVHA